MKLWRRAFLTVLIILAASWLPQKSLAVTFFAYHDASASQHQTYFDYYSSHGYRMISLSTFWRSRVPTLCRRVGAAIRSELGRDPRHKLLGLSDILQYLDGERISPDPASPTLR